MQNIFQKLLIFVVVSLAHMLDEQLTGSGVAIRTAVIFFYIANEGVSWQVALSPLTPAIKPCVMGIYYGLRWVA